MKRGKSGWIKFHILRDRVVFNENRKEATKESKKDTDL